MKFLHYVSLLILMTLCYPLNSMKKIKEFERKLAVIRKTALDRCLLNSDVIIVSELETGAEMRFKDQVHDEVCILILSLLQDTINVAEAESIYSPITIHCKRHGTSLTQKGECAHDIWQLLREYKNS